MVLYDRFIISLWLLFALATVALSTRGANSWDLYYVFYLIEYLIVSAVFSILDSRARYVLLWIASVLILGFVAILAFRVVGVLGGISL